MDRGKLKKVVVGVHNFNLPTNLLTLFETNLLTNRTFLEFYLQCSVDDRVKYYLQSKAWK